MNTTISKSILADGQGMSLATRRMVEALNDPEHQFSPDQVAYLLSIALRLGQADMAATPNPTRVEIDEAYERGYNDGLNAYDTQLIQALKSGLCGDDEVPWKTAVDRHHKQADALAARRERDAAAPLPRFNDYTGGPVEWEPITAKAAA